MGRVLMTGAGGLVGSALTPYLAQQESEVVPLLRAAPREDAPTWDPEGGRIDLAPGEPIDAVVHLAGENIAARRWSEEQKARIRESRAAGTRLLTEALAGLTPRPRVLIAASATGIYGDRGEEVLTEASDLGEGFLAEVGRAWEDATQPARDAGIRVVNLRIGIVLSKRGGALPKLLGPARLGLGGKLGSGRQWWPWIALDDLVRAIAHALEDASLEGPVNAVAPEPVRQAVLAKTLGRVLGRPSFLPTPRFALRIALGEMADALLLQSQRARPARLLESGYVFHHGGLESALRHVLG